MEAEYIMLTHFMGSDEGDRIHELQRTSAAGNPPMAPGACTTELPGTLARLSSATLHSSWLGDSSDEPHMAKARDFILRRGGVPKARVFTKIWLALFGQWDWKGTLPCLPI